MLIRYFNAEIQIVSLVNFTLLSQRSFVPSLASVTKSAVVGHFLSLREPTTNSSSTYILALRFGGTSVLFSSITVIKSIANFLFLYCMLVTGSIPGGLTATLALHKWRSKNATFKTPLYL